MTGWSERHAITGRRALVTGASKGIGAEICAVFADAGADIIAMARDAQGLEATAQTVRDMGRTCDVIAVDMADADAVKAAARQALDLGAVDILVNCAGIAPLGPSADFSTRDWDETMAVNLRAPFLLAQAVAPAMIARKRGKIVNVSSQTGVIAIEDHAAYAASKGGLNALTKSLCADWGRHNIQVNAICPTVVMTPMGQKNWSDPAKADPFRNATPARRFAEPVEVADMALFLASGASDMVNGALMMVEGGFTSV